MACDLKINKDGLLELVSGDLSCVDEDNQIEQSVRILLRTFQGEWFLDNRIGIDYFNKVFIKNPNLDDIQQDITNKVLSLDGVQSIIDYSQYLDSAKRQLNLSFNVITETGSTIGVNEIIP